MWPRSPPAVVRTSQRVVPISLPSVAGYAIADEEEVEATIPGAAFTPDNPDFSGDPVDAELPFTIGNLAGDEILADPSFTVLTLAEAAAFGPVAMQQRLLLL